MLSDDITTKFRDALRDHCATSGDSREGVHVIVRAAAEEARVGGITAEQFVIWVKQVWDDLIATGILPRGAASVRTREVIVSSAIKAYYVQ